VETYRALQVHAPDFAQIHYNLGVVYTILKQWDAAGDEFALAAKMGLIPPEVSVQPLLAQLRKDAKGKGEEKYVAVLREIVRANPEDTFSWNRLGIWHYRKNQLDEASGHFEKALEADDEYIPALNNLAGVYYQRRQYDKAIEDARQPGAGVLPARREGEGPEPVAQGAGDRSERCRGQELPEKTTVIRNRFQRGRARRRRSLASSRPRPGGCRPK